MTIALVLVAAVAAMATAGCSDGGTYAPSGSAGVGSLGVAGAGGSCDACDAGGGTSGAAGTNGTGDAGAGGSPGVAGSIGGSIGVGSAGSIGGAGGSAGSAGTRGPVTLQPWPSDATVVAVDTLYQFPKNVSDLVYQPPAGGTGDVLWAIQNDPSVLYCLLWGGTTWSSMTGDGWTAGKTLRYPDGTGSPDAEGITRAEWSSPAIYVATERNNSDSAVSRLSVLRYDTTAAGTSLNATHEWNLTKDLPAAGANLGLEGIAWIPDSYLVANKFVDESTSTPYDPSHYANHGTGVFFVGLENNGMIYGFTLDHSAGTFQRVATIESGHDAIMSLDFDRDQGNLWAYCDAGCANQAAVLRISGSGHFEITRLYAKPASLVSSNYEGITMAPESECDAQGFKSFFWTDDDDLGGHALWRGSIPCGPLP